MDVLHRNQCRKVKIFLCIVDSAAEQEHDRISLFWCRESGKDLFLKSALGGIMNGLSAALARRKSCRQSFQLFL